MKYRELLDKRGHCFTFSILPQALVFLQLLIPLLPNVVLAWHLSPIITVSSDACAQFIGTQRLSSLEISAVISATLAGVGLSKTFT